MNYKNIEYLKDLYSKDIERLDYILNLSEAEEIKVNNIVEEFKSKGLNNEILIAVVNLYIAQLKYKDVKRAYAINKKNEQKGNSRRVEVKHGQVKYIE